MVIFDQIVVKSSPGLISPSFSGQFFITRVTATPGFKILDGHVHYQSLDKTDNMSDCQLTIKETRYCRACLDMFPSVLLVYAGVK